MLTNCTKSCGACHLLATDVRPRAAAILAGKPMPQRRKQERPLATLGKLNLGAAMCVPRFDRATARAKLGSGDLEAWLRHHTARDVRRVFLYSDDCLNEVLPPDKLAVLAASISTTLTIQVVDIATLKDYNGWYHHQILAARDCFSRATSSGVAWALFMDVDEFLVIPPGWSGLDFGGSRALSFGSKDPCAEKQPTPCAHTFEGHRKYAISTAVRKGMAPLPPSYIHGDFRETKFNANGGVFMLHVRSECDATRGAVAAGKTRATDGKWLAGQLKGKGWKQVAAARGGGGEWTKDSGEFCSPYVFDKKRPWSYELTDAQLAELNKIP